MLTATSELAIRALILLGLRRQAVPLSPRALAESLDCSPSYLGKTLNLLVRAGILQSVRGARGGVLLAREPSEISVLSIVEACQGIIASDYCREVEPSELAMTCRYHRLMLELREYVVSLLANCSLEELVACPLPSIDSGGPRCRTWFPGIEPLVQRRA